MKLPIFEIKIDLNDDDTFMSCISLVSEPAVERNFIAFNNEKQPMQFAITDTEKHCITGVAIRANMPIYRYDEQYGGYYVVFTPETIEDIVFKYSKMNLWNSVSLQHSGNNIDDAVMVEYFIKGNGKQPVGFEDIEDGSLFCTYKITNEKLWEDIKSGDDITGFSVEIYSDLKPTGEYISNGQDMELSEEDKELYDFLKELFGDDAEILFGKDLKKNFVKYYTAGDIEDLMRQSKVYEITAKNGAVVEGQIYSLTNGGDSFEIMTVNNEWMNVRISAVQEIKATDIEFSAWDYNSPSYKAYIADDTITVKKSVTAPITKIEDAINQKQWVIINYNDDEPNPHTNARQCAVVAYGMTRRGNECIRVKQQYGDSRSIAEGYAESPLPDYRLMLTKRIQSWRVVDYADAWTMDLLNDGKYNHTGDDGMSVVYMFAE